MNRQRRVGMAIAGLAMACLVAGATEAVAHHSFGAEYDANKPLALTGVVTEVLWTNPHAYFLMDVKDASGSVVNWKFEGFSVAMLNRIGWKKNETMVPGDTVTIAGFHSRRDDLNRGQVRSIVFAKNGKKMEFGAPPGTQDGGSTPPVFDPAP